MNKPDPPIEKQNTYAPQHMAFHLANATNNEGLIDESNSLSKSPIVGSIKECKMRVLSFIWNQRVVQGLLQFCSISCSWQYSSFSSMSDTLFVYRKCC